MHPQWLESAVSRLLIGQSWPSPADSMAQTVGHAAGAVWLYIWFTSGQSGCQNQTTCRVILKFELLPVIQCLPSVQACDTPPAGGGAEDPDSAGHQGDGRNSSNDLLKWPARFFRSVYRWVCRFAESHSSKTNYLKVMLTWPTVKRLKKLKILNLLWAGQVFQSVQKTDLCWNLARLKLSKDLGKIFLYSQDALFFQSWQICFFHLVWLLNVSKPKFNMNIFAPLPTCHHCITTYIIWQRQYSIHCITSVNMFYW